MQLFSENLYLGILYTGPRIGNFIIGASGSDKQMLCGSSVARAAPTISAVNVNKI